MTENNEQVNNRDEPLESVGEVVRRKKGGPQPGSGRPKGKLNQSTLQAMAVKKKYLQRIRKNADRLFNAQFSLATGTQMLFVIHTDSKGRRGKPELVTDVNIISRFLDENEGMDGSMKVADYADGSACDDYFFITTKLPDSKTITDMLDRALGKPDQKLLIGDDEPSDSPYEDLTVEELRKLAGD
jgi:hypothetical protein